MMSEDPKNDHRELIAAILRKWHIEYFGIADLDGISTPADNNGNQFPRAISFAVLMDPGIMASIRTGPNEQYAEEYRRVNDLINEIAVTLETTIRRAGFCGYMIPASDRTDPVNIKGDFPHKTAATRAGLGWVGRNCLLISKRHGPWLRLGTVLTDLPARCDLSVTKSYCGTCRKCVDACPAGALIGNAWQPGMPREDMLNVLKCDEWKKEYFFQFNEGHNCGICAAVCPFGK
ncbi:MAG: 4Fe-4S double cluster binding domain-containing protein [Syntrophales bacterium]|nr:4Fe-4S double cluster binding domain-containing protein [Syntrophales bacterium]